MKFYTIGVYGSNEQEYFDKLINNRINTFCDIRQRRGVRGSQYTFVNSNKLQYKLSELDVKYLHIIDLVPNVGIRELQKEADKKEGITKQTRDRLGDIFTVAYENVILSKFDFQNFIDTLNGIGAKNIVLFCVEKNPFACHRSIVADKLMEMGFEIEHL